MLDEPTSGLDPIVRREFIETVIGAYQSGDPGSRTVFVSTHLISEFEGLIDEFTIIEQGCELLTMEADAARDRFRKIRARFAQPPAQARFARRVERETNRAGSGNFGQRQQRATAGKAPRAPAGGIALRIAVAGGNFRGVGHFEKGEGWKTMNKIPFNAETQRARRNAERVICGQTFLDCGGNPESFRGTPPWKLCPQPKSGVAAALQSSLRFASAGCHRTPKSLAGKLYLLCEPPRSPRLCVSAANLFPNRP